MAFDETLKKSPSVNNRELLKKGLTQIGFSCSIEQINAFMTLLSELKKWNRAYNLTSLKTDEDIIIKHFLDSLLYLKAIEEIASPRNFGARNDRMGRLKIADVGTGAGFPGIPIKIIKPEIHITLIEPSRKKTAFLRHIIRVLKLNRISVLDKRTETLGENYKESYDVIVSRATFKITDFLKKTCPYVKENGVLVLSKGPKISEEIKEIKNQSVIKEVIRIPLFKAVRNLLVLQCKKN